MEFITVSEASEKWEIGTRRVCILCKEGRIPGAVKKSRVWMIPKDAKKPDDGRKGSEVGVGNPFVFFLNPDYIKQNSGLHFSEEDYKLCAIQEKFFSGDIDGTYADICNLHWTNMTEKYQLILLLLKLLILGDCGKKEEYQKIWQDIAEARASMEEISVEMKAFDYLYGAEQGNYLELFEYEYYTDILPMLCLINARRGLTEMIQTGADFYILNYEIICNKLDQRDCPLISGYYHIVLAVYYNTIGDSKSYQHHIGKAVNILLPRGWYTPLAEYSATIDLSFIQEMDPKAYAKISNLGKRIISNYAEVGIFDTLSDRPRMSMNLNIQIGYKIVQGKSNAKIAEELGISLYKVKQHVDDLYAIVGSSSKKDIKAFILRNVFV